MTPQEEGKPIGILAREMTDRVAVTIARELDEMGAGALTELADLFGSMLFMAAQKLIELKRKTGLEVPEHEATIYSCSRLFNDCFAGNELAQRGLILPSVILLRSAFEVVTLGMLMMESGDVARRWFAGDRISQAEVRKSLSFAKEEHDRYKFLSDRIHPNVFGAPFHSVLLEESKGVAIAYGGWAATKSAGLTKCQFLYAQIAFLEAFYTNFSDTLAAKDLLWTSGTKDRFPEDVPMTWREVLANLKTVVTKINEQLMSMPREGTDLGKELESIAKAKDLGGSTSSA